MRTHYNIHYIMYYLPTLIDLLPDKTKVIRMGSLSRQKLQVDAWWNDLEKCYKGYDIFLKNENSCINCFRFVLWFQYQWDGVSTTIFSIFLASFLLMCVIADGAGRSNNVLGKLFSLPAPPVGDEFNFDDNLF